MTTDDSQSVQTTNTVCPIKSQLIQIKRFAHPDQLGLIRAPVIVFSSFAEEVSALRLSSDRLHDRALDKLASAVIATFLRALVAQTPTFAKYQRAKADCG